MLSVLPFKDEDDLIRQATDTQFGLAAAVWTTDVRRAHRVTHAIRAGTVWINAYGTVSFNTLFAGFKLSGFGRGFAPRSDGTAHAGTRVSSQA